MLLLPIAFGMLIVNLYPSIMAEPTADANGGLFYYLYQGVKLGIYPPLIFLGIGAMTDFGPLIANPKSFLLGAAAQLGIFVTFIGAMFIGDLGIEGLSFTAKEAGAIGIIGGADGPTAIFVTTKLADPSFRADCRGGIFLYGVSADYSAPYHACVDNKKRTHGCYGAASPCFQA